MTVDRRFPCPSLLLALPLMSALSPSPVSAQAHTESVQQAKVAWLDKCLSAKDHRVAGAGEGIFSGVLAGLAGDLLGAGVTALGDALERASREHAFSAEGLARFNYYRIDLAAPLGVALEPTFGAANGCLALSVQTPGAQVGLEDGKAGDRKNVGLDPRPQVYLEARLIALRDGFYVQPAYLAYLAPMSGAPKKASATELHFSFSTPAAVTENSGRGAIFALAQIRLPRLTPGPQTILDAEQLMHLGSAALAHRGKETIEAQRSSIAQVFEAVPAAIDAVESAKHALARAEKRLKALPANADAATRKDAIDTVELAREGVEDRELNLAEAREKKGTLEENLGGSLAGGITTAVVRFTVIRDANKFGMAIATALKGKAATAGTALTTHLTAAAPAAPPAWTEADTALVLAMSNAATAERALATAQAAGDAAAIFEKEIALRNAKAQANQAAAAAKKPLPFPEL